MPIILEWTYKDGTKEVERIPAQVWRLNENKVVKTFIKDKEVASVKLIHIGKQPTSMKAIINGKRYHSHLSSLCSNKEQVRQEPGSRDGPNPMQKAQEKKGF